MNINFFTPASKKLFNLIATDVGRPISDIAPKFDNPNLIRDIEGVIETLHPSSREVKDEKGRWFGCRIMPYRTSDNRILGTVITFDEISEVKKALETARSKEELKRYILNHMSEEVIFFDLDGKSRWSNLAAQEQAGKNEMNMLGLTCFEIWQPRKGEACHFCPVYACLDQQKEVMQTVKCGANRYIQAIPMLSIGGEMVGVVQVRKLKP